MVRNLTRYIAVNGTWSWTSDPHKAWWHPNSPFARFLFTCGLVPARPDKAFRWSGDLDGVPLIGDGNDWESGAEYFDEYCRCIPYEARNVIAHSHGGQPVLLAAAAGLKLRSLILVATPVRKDIEEYVAPQAVTNIGRTLHIVDARWDAMGLAGALFDFRLSFRRHFLVPGIVSEKVKGIGHSGVLYDPALFPLWHSLGWVECLTAPVEGV